VNYLPQRYTDHLQYHHVSVNIKKSEATRGCFVRNIVWLLLQSCWSLLTYISTKMYSLKFFIFWGNTFRIEQTDTIFLKDDRFEGIL